MKGWKNTEYEHAHEHHSLKDNVKSVVNEILNQSPYPVTRITALAQEIERTTSDMLTYASALHTIGMNKLANDLEYMASLQYALAHEIPRQGRDWQSSELKHNEQITGGLLGLIVAHGDAIYESQARNAENASDVARGTAEA